MSIFTRRADVSFFHRERFFSPVSAAIGELNRSPKIVSCTTMTMPPAGPTYIDAINIETIGASTRNAPVVLQDVYAGVINRLPSNGKVPLSFETIDLPKRVRKLFEETRKQHASTIVIASFDADPASNHLLVNSVELRIGKHVAGEEEEWLAQFIFTNSRLYTFIDRLRGFFAKK